MMPPPGFTMYRNLLEQEIDCGSLRPIRSHLWHMSRLLEALSPWTVTGGATYAKVAKERALFKTPIDREEE